MVICLRYIKGRSTAAHFFELLPKYFGNATTLYIEGVNIAEDVANCLIKHSDGLPYNLRSETVYPVSQKYRCSFSLSLIRELIELSKHHAEPEILDHIFIYMNSIPLLVWYDAFWGDIEISSCIRKDTIQNFVFDFGLEYKIP